MAQLAMQAILGHPMIFAVRTGLLPEPPMFTPRHWSLASKTKDVDNALGARNEVNRKLLVT